MEPFKFAVFFPPRIIYPDMTKGDHNAILDDCRDRYLAESLVLVDLEEGIKDAYAVIGFTEVNHPDLLRPE